MTATKTRPAKPEKRVLPGLFRAGRAPVDADELKIEREGGRFSAGIMRGVSLIARGEALGHDMWIDADMVQAVTDALAARDETGIKSRFTHPGLSSDGMGRHLGRLHSGRTEGDRSLADLHFAKAAHDTPDGDLAEYVMTLAGEDPEAAGLSIVFVRDLESETNFAIEHGAKVDRWGYVDLDEFQSPDPDNVNHLPHARLKELRAADVVDEPAANPDGMFDRQSLPRDADALLSYALGLSDQRPESAVLGVDPERASQFVNRFLAGNRPALLERLEAMSKDTTPANDPAEDPTPTPAPAVEPTPAPTPEPELSDREKFAAELGRYTAKFGSENGSKWFTAGKSWPEALDAHCDSLTAERDAALADAKEAKAKLASLELGQHEALDTGTPTEDKGKATLAESIKIRK